MAAALGSFSQQRLDQKLLMLAFINIIAKKQRLRALPRTCRLCYARSCTLTLAVSLGLRPNPPKALPLETAKGKLPLESKYVARAENPTDFLAKKQIVLLACLLLGCPRRKSSRLTSATFRKYDHS